MKIPLLAVSMGLLLCACGPATSTDPAPTTPPPDAATPAPPPAAAEAPAPDAVPPVATATITGETPASGDQAVNDSIDSNLGDHARYQSVIQALQAAVAAGDAAKVATLAQYPFGVDINGKRVVLKDEKEFVARYAEFMTDDIRKAIVETKYADLFVNYKGVMFGSGQAWINGLCKDKACKAFDVKLVTLQHGPE